MGGWAEAGRRAGRGEVRCWLARPGQASPVGPVSPLTSPPARQPASQPASAACLHGRGPEQGRSHSTQDMERLRPRLFRVPNPAPARFGGPSCSSSPDMCPPPATATAAREGGRAGAGVHGQRLCG